jgi:hypothetical protein
MLRIIDKQNFDQLLQSALTPSITVRADVALADRDLAKGRGYRWMPESKQWVKNMKADKIERERAEASFPVTVMPTK